MCGRKPKPPKINQLSAAEPAHRPGPGPGVFKPNPLPPSTHEGVPVSSGSNYENQKKTSEAEWKPRPKQEPMYTSPQLNSYSDETKAKESTKTSEPDWKPPPSQEITYTSPQLNSNSEDTKAKKPTKTSEPDWKPPPSREITYIPGPERRMGNQLQQSSSDSFSVPSGSDQKPTGPEATTPNTSLPATPTERPKLSSDSEHQVTRKMSELKPTPEKQKMISRESSLEKTPHKCPTPYKIEENTTECHTSAPEKQNAKPSKISSDDKKNKNSTRAIRSSQTTEKGDIESNPRFSATSQTDSSDSEGKIKNLGRIDQRVHH